MNTMEKELLTSVEAAEMLGCSARHVVRKSEQGEMPSPVRIGRAIRWRKQELLAWIAQGCPSQSEGSTDED